MGNFFTNPKERASQTMWDAAMSGKPVGAQYLDAMYDPMLAEGQQRIQATTSSRIAETAQDIKSRMESIGAPGGASEGLISRATAPIVSGEQSALGEMTSKVSSAKAQQLMQMILSQLSGGMAGMSDTSTFGDIMAGLNTVANLGGGIFQMSQGFGLSDATGWNPEWGKSVPIQSINK